MVTVWRLIGDGKEEGQFSSSTSPHNIRILHVYCPWTFHLWPVANAVHGSCGDRSFQGCPYSSMSFVFIRCSSLCSTTDSNNPCIGCPRQYQFRLRYTFIDTKPITWTMPHIIYRQHALEVHTIIVADRTALVTLAPMFNHGVHLLLQDNPIEAAAEHIVALLKGAVGSSDLTRRAKERESRGIQAISCPAWYWASDI